MQEAISLYSEKRRLLMERVPTLLGREFAEAVAQFHWNGRIDSTPIKQSPLKNSVALAIVGGPLPQSQWRLFDLIDKLGGRVVLNATDAGERSLLPTLHPDDTNLAPFETLAHHWFSNCVDVYQRPNTALYLWLKNRLLSRQVKGLLLWHFVGCDLWRAEAQSLREQLGLPVLALDADEAQVGSMRTVTRIEAFLEALRNGDSLSQ